MKTRMLLLALGFLLLAAIPRLLSLEAHWASDEARWLRRSQQFMSAVKQGEFSETLIAYHPGVPTMWIAGLRSFFLDPGVDVPNLAHARWNIGIMVSAGISIACLLLYNIFGVWIALTCFVSFVYSPLFLAQTRRVHTDALATTFILLAVLLILYYCQNRKQRRYLIFSGITYGLALLSKSYALILFPWLPVCLFLFREKQIADFWNHITEMLIFLTGTALTAIAFWPVFWTRPFAILSVCLLGCLAILSHEREKSKLSLTSIPLWASITVLCVTCILGRQTIQFVLERVGWAVTTPHEVEHFFLGRVVNDPGWLFYPFVLTIKSTPLMLPLGLMGCLLLWKQRKNSEETARYFRAALALVGGVMLFTVCLSATSKKFPRYLLPVFPLLEILASIGFVEGLKWLYATLESRFHSVITPYKKAFSGLACVVLFFIQVFPVMALHPYYGTYHNLFWKSTDISQIITVGSDASGVEIAAKYLNKKEGTTQMTIQASHIASEFLRYYFVGKTHTMHGKKMSDTPPSIPIAYEVVYIRDSQIGRVPQTGTLNGELEAVITLNGIEHVWIYRLRQENK